MSFSPAIRHVFILVLTGLTLAWAVFSWMNLGLQAHAGFDTDGNHTVIRVEQGSPAQQAGLLTGDELRYFDGAPAHNTAAIARQPRKTAGDQLALTFSRDGVIHEIGIQYRPATQQNLRLGQISILVGLCFYLFPALAWFRRPSAASRILLLAGFGLSLAFLEGPYVLDFIPRSLLKAGTGLLVMLGVAALMHFLLVFPHPRRWASGAPGGRLIYVPAVLLWLVIAFQMVFTPSSSSTLVVFTQFMSGIVIGAYLLLSLFLILRNYSRTSAPERKALAVNGMLVGTVLGILPALIAQLVSAFSPQSHLPGQDFYFVSLLLIPLAWARSAARTEEH